MKRQEYIKRMVALAKKSKCDKISNSEIKTFRKWIQRAIPKNTIVSKKAVDDLVRYEINPQSFSYCLGKQDDGFDINKCPEYKYLIENTIKRQVNGEVITKKPPLKYWPLFGFLLQIRETGQLCPTNPTKKEFITAVNKNINEINNLPDEYFWYLLLHLDNKGFSPKSDKTDEMFQDTYNNYINHFNDQNRSIKHLLIDIINHPYFSNYIDNQEIMYHYNKYMSLYQLDDIFYDAIRLNDKPLDIAYRELINTMNKNMNMNVAYEQCL